MDQQVLRDHWARLRASNVDRPVQVNEVRGTARVCDTSRRTAGPGGCLIAFVRAEQFAEDTGYPQERFDAPDLAAAELLAQLAGGESRVMGKLLANAYPAVPPLRPVRTMPDLMGRVVSIRWPVDGPPADLLGPAEPTTRAGSGDQTRRCEYCRAPSPGR